MSAQSISLKIKFKKKSSPTERGILTRYEHDCLRRCIGTATSLFIKLSPAALKCTGMLTSLLTYFLYTLPIRVYTFVFILRQKFNTETLFTHELIEFVSIFLNIFAIMHTVKLLKPFKRRQYYLYIYIYTTYLPCTILKNGTTNH